MSRVVTFKASEELIRDMDRAAKELGITRSELIKRAIIKYMIEVRERKPKETKIKIRRIEVG